LQLKPTFSDFLIITGLSLITAGLAMIYWPLALLVPGGILLLLGLLGAWRGATK